MNPIETYEMREAVRAVLDKYGLLENVQLEFDLISAITKKPEAKPDQVDHKQATLTALITGSNKNAQMESDWNRLFGTTPNWQTKTNRELMVWIKERAEYGETLDRFAEWWFANDWRGKQSVPPSASQVRELWGLAFLEGGNKKQQGNLPEGL